MWWKVDLGGVYNIYSVSIRFKNYIGKGTFITNIQIYEVFKIFKGFVVDGENVRNGMISPLYAHLNHETPYEVLLLSDAQRADTCTRFFFMLTVIPEF